MQRTRAIDYDKGVVIRRADKLGIEVFMYKRQPGVYLSQHGKTLPEVIAKEAGFDVDVLGKRARARARLTEFRDKLEAETELEEGKVVRRVVYEAGGFRVVQLGHPSRNVVEDSDGHLLTEGVFLAQDVAKTLVDQMAGAEAAREAVPTAAAASGDGVGTGGKRGAAARPG